MADIKKMKSVGICTVKGIQMTTRKALCNIKGLSEAKVEKIKEAAGKMLVKLDCLLEVELLVKGNFFFLRIRYFYFIFTECGFPDCL